MSADLAAERRRVLLRNLWLLIWDQEWLSYRWLSPEAVARARAMAEEAGVDLVFHRVDLSDLNGGGKHG